MAHAGGWAASRALGPARCSARTGAGYTQQPAAARRHLPIACPGPGDRTLEVPTQHRGPRGRPDHCGWPPRRRHRPATQSHSRGGGRTARCGSADTRRGGHDQPRRIRSPQRGGVSGVSKLSGRRGHRPVAGSRPSTVRTARVSAGDPRGVRVRVAGSALAVRGPTRARTDQARSAAGSSPRRRSGPRRPAAPAGWSPARSRRRSRPRTAPGSVTPPGQLRACRKIIVSASILSWLSKLVPPLWEVCPVEGACDDVTRAVDSQ